MRITTGLIFLLLGATPVLADKGPAPAPAPPPPQAPVPPPAASDGILDHSTMLAPIQIDGLTLTPIVTTTPGKAPDLLVLDEAMATKQVKITEVASGDVNNLELTNKSTHPLFLLAGEVILGGKQDRIIGRNTIIPAHAAQEVPVFCVEHGRWDGKSNEFVSAKALAHGRLRGDASFASQQDVWDDVAATNQARKTTSETDTYRTVANHTADGTLAASRKRVDAALAKLAPADRDNMIGYAVALDGKVATVDVFKSPALFKKLESKLVSSYLSEAVGVQARADMKPPTPVAIKEFMADAASAEAQKSYDTTAADTVVNSGKYAARAKVSYKSAPPAAAAPRPAHGAVKPAAADADDDVYETFQVLK